MAKRISGSVLLLTTLAFSLVVGEALIVAAQEPQNQPATPQTEPTPKPKTTTKRKRGQMKMTTPTNETTTGDQTTATPADTTTAAQTTPARNMESTQTDLSGTYAGTFNCDALGLTGDTTLTVNGNEFSTADGKTGRIVASTTRGYTAVALQTGDMPGATATTPTTAGAATTAPTIVSLRAHKSGNRLTLTSVPGATMPCSFSTSRTARRSRQTPAAAGTTVASPAEAGATPADVTTPAQPARTRRGSKRNPSTTTPSAMPNSTNPTTQPAPETPMPAQTPSPEPTQSPSPEPNPAPSPNPSGSPTPMPNPSPSATPTPSPTPSPSPNPGRPRG